MISEELLNDVQSEFSKLEQMIDALDLLTSELDAADSAYARKQRNAVIGIKDAILDQIAKGQAAYEKLYPALRASGGTA